MNVSPELLELLRQIEQSDVAQAIRGVSWLYPVLESVHILGIGLLYGAAVAVDLRQIGVGRRRIPVRAVTRGLLPLSHVGFGLAAVSGLAMFIGVAVAVVRSDAFLLKYGLILVAAINILVFHFGIYRRVDLWNDGPTPVAAKVAGCVSIVCWTGTVFAGRWLAYA